MPSNIALKDELLDPGAMYRLDDQRYFLIQSCPAQVKTLTRFAVPLDDQAELVVLKLWNLRV